MSRIATVKQAIRRRPRLAALGAGGVAVVIAGISVAALLLWPRGATPITGRQALDEFRDLTDTGSGPAPPRATQPSQVSAEGTATQAAGSGAGTPGSPAAAAGSPGTASVPGGAPSGGWQALPLLRPPQGVYSYAASGQEVVHLGPASQTRTLADQVTATVLWTRDGCWIFRHNLFAEHTEDTVYCPGDDGSLRSTAHTKRQKLGAVTATAEMTCDIPLLAAPPVPGRSISTSCDMATQTPVFTARSTHAGTITVVAAEEITVGAVTIPTWHVSIRRAVSGDIGGHWNEDIWFSARDGLPVRVSRDAQLAGPATFTERSTFTLLSPDPQT